MALHLEGQRSAEARFGTRRPVERWLEVGGSEVGGVAVSGIAVGTVEVGDEGA